MGRAGALCIIRITRRRDGRGIGRGGGTAAAQIVDILVEKDPEFANGRIPEAIPWLIADFQPGGVIPRLTLSQLLGRHRAFLFIRG